MQGRRSVSSRREASRLPRIAPRTGTGPSTPHPQRPIHPSRIIPPNSSQSKTPSRSRSGCQTCRRRKVKCDEQRPDCGHCTRLGHECDYTPKLDFRDDTSKVKRKTKDFTTIGSSVWKANLPTPEYRLNRLHPDSLPPFSSLTSDEYREKKAQTQKAGTYMVIANLKSFASLPEYLTDEPSSSLPIPGQFNYGVLAHSAQPASNIQSATEELDNTNIIILKTFEDYLRRSPISAISNSSPTFAASSQPPTALEPLSESIHGISHGNEPVLSRLDEARSGGRDAHLLAHYRSHISEQVIKIGSHDAEEDAFESQARTFPPLFHAMMAISALSLSHKIGTQVTEAKEHYAQVLPAIGHFVQRVEESYSDGPLFTYYLLLLYETASAGPSQYSEMWQSHRRTLLTIISERRQAYRTEPHGFLVLVICLVDTYALLSGSGDGALVNSIMKNNILAPQDCLPPLTPGHPQRYFDDELPYFPGLLELNQRLIKLATKVGRTARTLRTEDSQRRVDPIALVQDGSAHEENKKKRVQDIQTLCRTLASEWEARHPQYWLRQLVPRNLPHRVRGLCDHVYTLYRTCIIYSHTSLHSGQMARLTTDFNVVDDVFGSATEIIELSQQLVTDGQWELQFMPFSLFLAGVVSRRKEEKMTALRLMIALEQKSYGKNTATVRRLLETIYDKQQATTGRDDPDLNVDWLEVMETSGLRLVFFGM